MEPGNKNGGRLAEAYIPVFDERESLAGTRALIDLNREMMAEQACGVQADSGRREWLKRVCERLCLKVGLLRENPEWLQGEERVSGGWERRREMWE